jgi:hypothetical protein
MQIIRTKSSTSNEIRYTSIQLTWSVLTPRPLTRGHIYPNKMTYTSTTSVTSCILNWYTVQHNGQTRHGLMWCHRDIMRSVQSGRLQKGTRRQTDIQWRTTVITNTIKTDITTGATSTVCLRSAKTLQIRPQLSPVFIETRVLILRCKRQNGARTLNEAHLLRVPEVPGSVLSPLVRYMKCSVNFISTYR